MSKWTDERVSLLKQLWGEGKTAKEIAGLLGGGLTRNAVIGKAHRLKLSGRVSPIQQNKSIAQKAVENKARATGKLKDTVRAKASKAAAAKAQSGAEGNAEAAPVRARRTEVPEELMRAQSNNGKGVSLLEINDRMCRWPVGDPQDKDFHFCGARCDSSQPYCDTHAQIAFNVKLTKRKVTVAAEPTGKSLRDEADDLLSSVANGL